MILTRLKTRILILTSLCFCIGFVLIPVQAQSSTKAEIIETINPVVEKIDLVQTGNLTHPYIANLTKNFSIVQKTIWNLNFAENSLDYLEFAGDSALTNGINIFYNGESVLHNDNITDNAHFSYASHDMSVFSDDQSPKNRLLVSSFSFTTFTDAKGLTITPSKTIQFYIQDNLTALTSISLFQVIVEGYQLIQSIIYVEQAVGEDWLSLIANFYRDNQVALLGLGVAFLGVAFIIWFRRKIS